MAMSIYYYGSISTMMLVIGQEYTAVRCIPAQARYKFLKLRLLLYLTRKKTADQHATDLIQNSEK